MLKLDIVEVLGRRFGYNPIYAVHLLQAAEVVDPEVELRLCQFLGCAIVLDAACCPVKYILRLPYLILVTGYC